MKRRDLIALGLSSAAATVAGRSWAAQGDSPLSGWQSEDLSSGALPTRTTALRFAAIGDVGTGDAGQYAVAEAMRARSQSAPFSAVLMTGDNIYPSGDISRIKDVFERPYAPLLQRGVKFYATLGNHDFQARRGQAQINYPAYNMTGRQYTFTQGNAQFFALDTNLAFVGGDRAEAIWLSQVAWLRAALGRSRAQWKIVFAHHPLYSSGRHGSNEKLIAVLAPIFADYGVQLYLNGHDHNYERTEPINGTTYITTGNGARLRSVGSSDWTAYAIAQLGFTSFDVYADQIVVKAIGTDNQVYDEATISA